MTKKRVSYFYHPNSPNFYYGAAHPMKPFRLKLTHNLILSYGLQKEMDCYIPHAADHMEMTVFHGDDYIRFLNKISPDVGRQFTNQCRKFNVGPDQDCPSFEGLYEFCQLISGGSIDAAVQLCLDRSDIAINWSGGFHHAQKRQASGFCYVNDIVLAICEMLKLWPRVLYIDIDVHHGDAVEEAFYTTDRVMTFSLHKYGDGFFPRTGSLDEKGTKDGKGYSLNVPLDNGVTDEQYFEDIFKPIFDKIMEIYQPGAIFLQCGADSLAADRLGTFNVTTKGHAQMVDYVKSKNVPMLVTGGGGYTVRNVARAWCYETAVLVDKHDIPNEIPFNPYFEYFAPTYDLHLLPEKMDNLNDKATIDNIRSDLLQQLQDLEGAPGIAMQEVPPPYIPFAAHDEDGDVDDDDDDDEEQPAKKKKPRKQPKQHPSELYDNPD